jgi:hypothetical protein
MALRSSCGVHNRDGEFGASDRFSVDESFDVWQPYPAEEEW